MTAGRRAAVLALLLAACGVKAPPRPPLPETAAPRAVPAGASRDGASTSSAPDGTGKGAACQDDECRNEEEQARKKASSAPAATPRTPSP